VWVPCEWVWPPLLELVELVELSVFAGVELEPDESDDELLDVVDSDEPEVLELVDDEEELLPRLSVL
jgi:hypothetical protein